MLSIEVQDSVAETLKQKTHEQHMALEAMLVPHLQSLASTDAYAHLLSSFYGYYKPVENAIALQLSETIVPDIKSRVKSHAILHDLVELNYAKTTLPLAQELPTINHYSQALGALYVLEGSTLGGRGITKMLLKNTALQLKPQAVQFFNGYGEATGKMWTSFVQTLNSTPLAPTEMNLLVTAANETFLYFKIWLQKALLNG